MKRLFPLFAACLCGMLLAVPSAQAEDSVPQAAKEEFFEKRIRPFLVSDCYECHGPKKQEGGLRLDYQAACLEGGDSGPAIVPGDAKNSLLIQTITHEHEYFAMPKGRPKLPDSVIAAFKEWVDNGAVDTRTEPVVQDALSAADWDSIFAARRQHWSFLPVTEPTVPQLPEGYFPLMAEPSAVDSFVAAKLREQGLQHGPAADPLAWLRRVTFVLTGLPPTPAEVVAFSTDSSPPARQRVVERLLASPHFGEHWARHWMDLVRYAESFGHEQDFDIPHAWRYRDYLIRAFNEDVPYDQLVKEHVAGDLLTQPRLNPEKGFNESIFAPAFWFMHQATHSPVDVVQDEADRIDNQIDVFSKAFLGLTTACARCHDHKFDPISTKDYYSLSAYMRASRQDFAFVDMEGKLAGQIDSLRQKKQEATEHLVHAVRQWEAAETDSEVDPAQSIANEELADLPKAKRDPLAPEGSVEPFGRDFSQWHASGPAFVNFLPGSHRWRLHKDSFELLRPGIAHSGVFADGLQGVLRSPSFTLPSGYLHLRVAGKGGKIRLVIQRYQLRPAVELLFEETLFDVNTDDAYVWHTLHANIERYQGRQAYLELIDEGDGYLALDRLLFSPSPLDAELSEAKPSPASAARHVPEKVELRAWLNFEDSPALAPEPVRLSREKLAPELAQQLQKMESLGSDLAKPTRVLSIAAGTDEPTFVFVRGNPKVKGERVSAGCLPVLNASGQGVTGAADRMALAEQMTSPDNPLLYRVYVNRVWAHVFGRGIVSTVDNFGSMGERPTHPELLDYLTMRFVREGKSLKGLLKELCLSQTFALSSDLSDQHAENQDPGNVYLHRSNLRRLGSESIRDGILAASGKWDAHMFGPPVPVHLTPFMGDASKLLGRGFAAGPLDGAGRRSIYQEVRRNFLPPLMLTFDFPIPDSTIGQRNASNVPAQALALMNDPFVQNQAEEMAKLLLEDSTWDDRRRLDQMFLRTLGRWATEKEIEQFMAFMDAQRKVYQASPSVELKVWTDACHLAFMLQEFVYVR